MGGLLSFNALVNRHIRSLDNGWPGRGPRQGILRRYLCVLTPVMTVKHGGAFVYQQEEEGEEKYGKKGKVNENYCLGKNTAFSVLRRILFFSF